MDPARIASLLAPFLAPGSRPDDSLTDQQLAQVSTYLDLLLKWNAHINLTSVRQPEEIVTRHFGESFFTARQLFPSPLVIPSDSRLRPGGPKPRAESRGRSGAAGSARSRDLGRSKQEKLATSEGDGLGISEGHDFSRAEKGSMEPGALAPVASLIDLGSGAGFPGLPIKLYAPALSVTLIESNQKKATFLREVIRALALTNIDVFAGRAEDFPATAAIVTLRAVEEPQHALAAAARLVSPGGRLALLIGASQAGDVPGLLSGFSWAAPVTFPGSSSRIILTGARNRQEPAK